MNGADTVPAHTPTSRMFADSPEVRFHLGERRRKSGRPNSPHASHVIPIVGTAHCLCCQIWQEAPPPLPSLNISLPLEVSNLSQLWGVGDEEDHLGASVHDVCVQNRE